MNSAGAIIPRLGCRQRIRASKPLVRIAAIMRGQGYSDAGSDDNLMALDLVRLADDLDHAAGEHARIFGLLDGGLNDRKFVASKTRDGINFPNAPAQPLGGIPQERVSHRVSERVVYLLEVIEV